MSEKLVEVKDLEISFGEGSKKFVAVKNANFFTTKVKHSLSLENLVVVRQQLVVPLSALMIPAKGISSLMDKKSMVKNHVNKQRN